MKMNMRVDRVTPVKMDYVYNGIREKLKIDPCIICTTSKPTAPLNCLYQLKTVRNSA